MCPVPGPRVLGSSVTRQSLTCDPPGGHRLQRRRELPAAAGGGRGPGAGARGPPRCPLSLCPLPLWATWVIRPSQDIGESRGTLTPRVLAGLQPPGLGDRSNLGSAQTLQTCYHRERPRGPERCLAPPGSPPGRPRGSAPFFLAVVGQFVHRPDDQGFSVSLHVADDSKAPLRPAGAAAGAERALGALPARRRQTRPCLSIVTGY